MLELHKDQVVFAWCYPFLFSAVDTKWYEFRLILYITDSFILVQRPPAEEILSSPPLVLVWLSTPAKVSQIYFSAARIIGRCLISLLSVPNRDLGLIMIFRRVQPPPATLAMVAGGGVRLYIASQRCLIRP